MNKLLKLLSLSLFCASVLSAQTIPTIAADIVTGSAASFPYSLTPVASKLYFQAGFSPSANEVYEFSSGTASSVASSPFTSAVSRGAMSFFNGKLYFPGNAGGLYNRLYAYNPSGGTTVDVCDTVDAKFGVAAEVGGKLYFYGQNNVTSQYGMFYVDASGLVHMAAIIPISLAVTNSIEVAIQGTTIYFTGSGAGSDVHLYRFNTIPNTFVEVPTPGATMPDVRSLIAGDDGKIYYSDVTGTGGREIFSYGGTGAPTQLTTLNGSADGVDNPLSSGATIFYGHNIIKWGSKLFFSGCDGTHGYELMSLDLPSGTPTLVKDINPNTATSSPGYFAVYNSHLYFSADNGTNGRELWVSDGTAANTTLVADTNPGLSGSEPWYMTVHTDGLMYFSATDGASGNELFKLNSPLGIQHLSKVISAVAYPNPAATYCQIEVELKNAQSINVTLSDNAGRVVETKVSSSNQVKHLVTFSMLGLPVGIYHYRITDQGNALLATGTVQH
jgi:ELWxxDGT repeat protein